MTDSEGNPPKFHPNDRVYVLPLGVEATVIKQILHYDMNESFWGNVRLRYDDGIEGESNSWQLKKVEHTWDNWKSIPLENQSL